jgi:hypothetical protein
MTILGYSPNYDWDQGIYAIIFIAIMSYNLRVGFIKLFSDEEEDNYDKAYVPCAPRAIIDTVKVTKKSKEPFGKDDWDEICRMAIESAKEGDHRARDWVMKNVVVGTSASGGTKGRASFDSTPKSLINDAVEFLRGLGHSKAEASRMVNAVARSKKYDNVEDLIKDLYKKKG